MWEKREMRIGKCVKSERYTFVVKNVINQKLGNEKLEKCATWEMKTNENNEKKREI